MYNLKSMRCAVYLTHQLVVSANGGQEQDPRWTKDWSTFGPQLIVIDCLIGAKARIL